MSIENPPVSAPPVIRETLEKYLCIISWIDGAQDQSVNQYFILEASTRFEATERAEALVRDREWLRTVLFNGDDTAEDFDCNSILRSRSGPRLGGPLVGRGDDAPCQWRAESTPYSRQADGGDGTSVVRVRTAADVPAAAADVPAAAADVPAAADVHAAATGSRFGSDDGAIPRVRSN